jgi:hypothetical protein
MSTHQLILFYTLSFVLCMAASLTRMLNHAGRPATGDDWFRVVIGSLNSGFLGLATTCGMHAKKNEYIKDPFAILALSVGIGLSGVDAQKVAKWFGARMMRPFVEAILESHGGNDALHRRRNPGPSGGDGDGADGGDPHGGIGGSP